MTIDAHRVMTVIRFAAPKFRNAHDKVVFVVSTSFFASGFMLHAAGSSAFVEDALLSPSIDETSINNWNELDDCYGFVFSKDSNKILLKCFVLNDHLLVHILREGDSESAQFEINVKEYVADEVEHSYESMYKNFKQLVGFIDSIILSKYA